MEVARLVVKVGGDIREAVSNLKTLDEELKKSNYRFGQGAAALGQKLTMGLTLPIVGIGAAAVKMAADVDSGLDLMIRRTGATGEAARKMEDVFRRVAPTVTQQLDEVGKAIGELQTRTGLTGEPLERLSRQVLHFADITEQDAGEAVRSLTRLMGDWGIEQEKINATMDQLVTISQTSGAGLQALQERMVQYGAPLRLLGFGFEKTIALMGKWEKEGVSLEKIMGTLQIGVSRLAKSGATDLPQAFQATIQAIADAKTSIDAVNIASETFGTRAGPDLAAAVREGRFAIEEWTEALKSAEGQTNKTWKETLSWDEQLGMLRNKLKLLVEPIGNAIGPVVTEQMEKLAKGAEKAVEAFKNLDPATQKRWIQLFEVLAAAGPTLYILGKMASAITAISAALKIGAVAASTFWGALAGPLAVFIPLFHDFIVDFKGELAFWRGELAGFVDRVGQDFARLFDFLTAPFQLFSQWINKWLGNTDQTLQTWGDTISNRITDWSNRWAGAGATAGRAATGKVSGLQPSVLSAVASINALTPVNVSSGFRPGAIVQSGPNAGKPSFHAEGLAADLVSAGNRPLYDVAVAASKALDSSVWEIIYDVPKGMPSIPNVRGDGHHGDHVHIEPRSRAKVSVGEKTIDLKLPSGLGGLGGLPKAAPAIATAAENTRWWIEQAKTGPMMSYIRALQSLAEIGKASWADVAKAAAAALPMIAAGIKRVTPDQRDFEERTIMLADAFKEARAAAEAASAALGAGMLDIRKQYADFVMATEVPQRPGRLPGYVAQAQTFTDLLKRGLDYIGAIQSGAETLGGMLMPANFRSEIVGGQAAAIIRSLRAEPETLRRASEDAFDIIKLKLDKFVGAIKVAEGRVLGAMSELGDKAGKAFASGLGISLTEAENEFGKAMSLYDLAFASWQERAQTIQGFADKLKSTFNTAFQDMLIRGENFFDRLASSLEEMLDRMAADILSSLVYNWLLSFALPSAPVAPVWKSYSQDVSKGAVTATTEGTVGARSMPPINVNIYARDVESFRRSRGQVAQDVAGAVATARRFA